MIRLVVTDPDGVRIGEHDVELPVVLGRDPAQCAIALSDRMVSRRHARVEPDGADVVLVDLESANGTWIAEERVGRRVLGPDDVIVLGEHRIAWSRPPAPARPVGPVRAAVEQAADDPSAPLSFEHGLLPAAPRTALPDTHTAWDELAACLPAALASLTLHEVVAALPVRSADGLPDADLPRAATVLGLAAHAWCHVGADPEAALPAALEGPWREVGARLGRPVPHLSWADLVLHNWRRDESGALEVLVPLWGHARETAFVAGAVAELAAFGPVLRAMADAAEADGETARLTTALAALDDALAAVPEPAGGTWSAPGTALSRPVVAGAPSLEDTMPDPTALLDAFLGRPPAEVALPASWRALVDAVAAARVGKLVADAEDEALRERWARLEQRGTELAGRHRGLHRPPAADPVVDAAPTRDVGDGWGVVLTRTGMRILTTRDLVRAWVRAAGTAARLAGALETDLGPAAPGTAYGRWLLLDAHERFLGEALPRLLATDLDTLARLTTPMCAPDRPVDWFASRLQAVRGTPAHGRLREAAPTLRRLAAADAPSLVPLTSIHRSEDHRVLSEIRDALHAGLAAVDEHGGDVLALEGEPLLAALARVLVAVAGHDTRLATWHDRLGVGTG